MTLTIHCNVAKRDTMRVLGDGSNLLLDAETSEGNSIIALNLITAQLLRQELDRFIEASSAAAISIPPAF